MAIGKEVVIAELDTQSVIPTLMRYIIRRYLKKVGLKDVDVIHRSAALALKLVIEANISEHLTAEQKRKIGVLVSAIEFLLEKADGRGAEIDTEELRNTLAKEEPSLRKAFYTVERAAFYQVKIVWCFAVECYLTSHRSRH